MSTTYLAGPEIRPFTTFENETLRDPNLSYRALGVLARLRSNAPGFKQDSRALARERPFKEGRDAIRSALRELEEAGYCRRVLARKPGGTIYGQFVFFYGSLEAAAAHQIGNEIKVDEEGKPIPEDRGPENPAAGFPGARKTRRPDFQARKRKKEQIRKPPPPTPSISAKEPPPKGSGGGDLIDNKSLSVGELGALLDAAEWGERQAGRPVGLGFRPWKRGRLLERGPSPDDLALLDTWRASFQQRRPEIRDERADEVRLAVLALTSALSRGLEPAQVERERAELRRLAPSHPLLQTKTAAPRDGRTTS